jgi:TolB-like protein
MSRTPDPADPRPSTPAHRRWFAELKRRRVFRVVAVYGAVSFVVMEVADLVFPAIPLPAWTVSLVVWLAILGFPFAVAFAWIYEVTPDGEVRRTESAAPEEIEAIAGASALRRWTPGVLALTGVALLAIGFYGGWRTGPAGDGVPSGAAGGASGGLEAPGTGGADVVVTDARIAYVDLEDDPRPAIAVLPFADLSPAGDQAYFSDGVSEELLTVLAHIRDLRVAGRGSGFAYRGSELDLRAVGAELGVGYLLGGSVRRSGDDVRIRAELVDASDGLTIWAESYDRRLESIFQIQSEIAEAIASELRISLGLEPEALVKPTLDTEAHDLYLSARAAMRRRGPGVGEAIRLFEAAIERDPAWAPAWAGLAEAHAMFPFYPGTGAESMDSTLWATNLERAEASALRALELDPGSASARVALGGVHRDRWEWEAGERELLQALEIDPDNHEAHIQYAELLWGTGRLDEALRESTRALALDRTPLSLDVQGFVLYMNGRWEEAEAHLLEGLALDEAGEMHFLRTVYAHLLLMDGRYSEALERFADYLPDAAAYEAMGRALEERDPSLLPERRPRGWTQVALLIGEEELALDGVEELVFRLPFRVVYDLWDPISAPIVGSRRFQEVILPRVNLEGVVPRYDRR